jgi:hypothetical protein
MPTAGFAEKLITVRVEPGSAPASVDHLRIAFKNVSSKTLKMFRSNLPWGIISSMIVVAVRQKGRGEAVEKAVPPIDDQGGDTVDIRPGQTLNGEINLEYFIKSLDQERTNGDLLLFWSYEPRFIDGPTVPRISGAVELKKCQ